MYSRLSMIAILCVAIAGLHAQTTNDGAVSRNDLESDEERSVSTEYVPPDESLLSFDDEAAQLEGDGGEGSVAFTQFGFWNLARAILVLIVVIGAIYLLFVLIRKASKTQFPASSMMRLIGTLSLQSNRFVHIIAVGAQFFLIGSSEHGVSLISELSDKETIDDLRLQASSQSPRPKNFSRLLGKFFQSDQKGGDKADPLNFLTQKGNRLKEL